MAVKKNTHWRHGSVLALAVAALSLPGMAMANPDDGRPGGWRSQGESRSESRRSDDGGQRAQQQAPQQSQRRWSAPAPQAAPAPAPQVRSGEGWGNRGLMGGNRERSRAWNNGEHTPQGERARAPEPQPRQSSGWSGNRDGTDQRSWRDRAERTDRREDRRDRGGNWQGGTQTQSGGWTSNPQRTERRDGQTWTNRDGRSGGLMSGDRSRYRDSDRHRTYDRSYWRDRNWSSNHWDRSRQRWSGWNNNWNWTWGSSYNNWNTRWRTSRRYDWYGWRTRHPDYYRVGSYYSPYRNYSYRRLSIGFFLDTLFFGQDYWIADPWYYRLPEVYGPYRWVRYYDDAVLVNIYTGEVEDVIYDFFW